MSNRTRIYFHICTMGHWYQTVKKIFQIIKQSRLLDHVEDINIGLLSTLPDAEATVLNLFENQQSYDLPLLLKLS